MELLATLLTDTILNPAVLGAAIVLSVAQASGFLAHLLEAWEDRPEIRSRWSLRFARSSRPEARLPFQALCRG